MGDKFEPPKVDKFVVLSAIWPFISGLCAYDEKFFSLVRNIRQRAEDLYNASGI